MSECIEITTGPVAKMSDTHRCKICRTKNDVEKAFVAKCISESPDLFKSLGDGRKGIENIEEARQIATRLNLSDAMAPVLICDDCGQPMQLDVKNYIRKMAVPAELECVCGQHINLHFQRDKEKIRFTRNWPHVPYLRCSKCSQNLLIPIRGSEAWRAIAFKMIKILTVF